MNIEKSRKNEAEPTKGLETPGNGRTVSRTGLLKSAPRAVLYDEGIGAYPTNPTTQQGAMAMSKKSDDRTIGFMINPSPSLVVKATRVGAQEVAKKNDRVEEMAPLMFGGWKPSAEQRRTAEHFGNTGDVFDLLGR